MTPPRFIEPAWPAPEGAIALSTLRCGGVSAGAFVSFNLGHHVGDIPAAVVANRESLVAGLPENTQVQWLSQVHGTRVIQALGDDNYPEADACWTDQPGIACAVMTADCLPVLFCTADGKKIGAAHAGWRGLVSGVLEATVAAIGVDPASLLAWLGPAIGPISFEVGPEVEQAFSQASSEELRDATGACFTASNARPGYYLADIYALARLRLSALGLDRVYGGEHCTVTESERFFSYRRDGQTGRMATLILLNPS